MIDPFNSVNWNKEIIGVDAEGEHLKVMISNVTGTPTMWGWSVFRRQGGYRTYGLSVETMLSRGWRFYESMLR
jgi:hypothetical protein